ncbi:hypothetical protein OV090_03670 [Nannocystis sp. RBIL2]|uniref:hypothetical protein n=1 Tax=Nannocystis sp. RBIL2 TaxID=2996788 RepID=UPI00226FBBBE|nr:hypothetical protein [Nannocystis sp. RBIL2]MCY1063844.1 hypothetical protein [Nannocystis sp. RBIL2]
MQAPAPRRLLISAVSLAVVAACDPELAPRPETTAREASLLAAPGLDCLTDTKLRLHHDDGTLDVTTDLAAGLAELARPRDLVELSFAVTPQCAADHRRVTLAAYTTQGINLGLDPVYPPTAFDVHTTRLGGDTYLLRVRLPDCYYELDLAFGEPLPVQRPQLSYAAQSRLILAAIGGDTTCDEAPLAVERFDPVEAGWGDAPVSAHFGWRLTADPAAQLRCEFDFDADGQPDVIHEPCSRTTELVKTAALPQWTYPVGKHRPELVVSDGQRRIWAGTDIYANHLDYKPDVHFLEERPDFLGADVTVEPAPDLSQVVLHFKDAATLPDVAAGEVVVGHGGARGYMLRVEAVTYEDADLVLLGVPVGLDDVLAGGFFGVRDLPIDTSDVACVAEPCPDEIVVLPDLPAGPGETAEIGTLALDESVDPIPPPGGPRLVFKFGDHGELHFSPGLDVERFELDVDWFSVPHADVAITPTIHASIVVKAGLTQAFEFGELYLGTLPLAIPVSIMLRPELEVEAAYKFTGTVAASATGTAFKDHTGWRTGLETHVDGLLDNFGAAMGPELSATLLAKFVMTLGFLDGPYVAPLATVGLRNTMDGCETCNQAFWEGGAEFGWEAFGSELFDAIKIILAAGEIWKDCEATGPSCEPLSGGPVIVRPRDGVLLDCQQYPKLVFRAPGAATTEDVNSPHQFTIHVNATHQQHGLYDYVVNTAFRGGLPEWDIQCVPLGDDGWGECSFTPADNPCSFGGSQWSNHSWSVTAHVPPASGSPTDVATFDVP